MRILMVTDFYPPIIGGMEIHVRNLSAELAARGHEMAVVTLQHAGLPEFEQDGQIRVYRIRGTAQRITKLFSDPGRQFAPPFPDPETMVALRRVIARERPQIVHAHNWMVYGFAPLKRWSGAKLVYTLHDPGLVCVKKSLMYEGKPCTGPAFGKCLGCAVDNFGFAKGVSTLLAKRLMGVSDRHAVDMFLPVSESVAQLSGLADSNLPFRVVSNFVPDDVCVTRSDLEGYLSRLPGDGYLLFVGALIPDKGIDILFRAYTRIPDAPPLVLIGATWPGVTPALPANAVIFENWPHDAVMAAWARCSLGLVPSVSPEPCATVVMEAMASGRPVIASRIGGMPELVAHGDTGLLVPPGDANALGDAIQRLLTDRELRERMGEAGRRRIGRFQASAIVPQVEQVYQDLLQRAPLPARVAV